jgi:hypothetical protein
LAAIAALDGLELGDPEVEPIGHGLKADPLGLAGGRQLAAEGEEGGSSFNRLLCPGLVNRGPRGERDAL